MEELSDDEDDVGEVVGEVESVDSVELKDIRKGRGRSLQKSFNTALSHFSKFLSYLHSKNAIMHPYTGYIPEEMNPEYFTTALIGQFADYLLQCKTDEKQRDYAYLTIEGYLSRVKTDIYSKYETNLHIERYFKGKQAWFSDLRRQCRNLCNEKCVQKGTKLTNSAPPMTSSDMEQCCQILFESNTCKSFMDRCMLIFTWQMFGRISEIGHLSFSDVVFYTSNGLRCLKVHINRTKTCNEHYAMVFVHQNFLLCPLHSLACMLSIHCTGGHNLFPNCSFCYMNKFLKDVTEEINDRIDAVSGTVYTPQLLAAFFVTIGRCCLQRPKIMFFWP